jgi:hypothetical protein
MSGALPLLPLYAFIVWIGTNLLLFFWNIEQTFETFNFDSRYLNYYNFLEQLLGLLSPG